MGWIDRQSRLPVSVIPASPKVYLQGPKFEPGTVLYAVSTMYIKLTD